MVCVASCHWTAGAACSQNHPSTRLTISASSSTSSWCQHITHLFNPLWFWHNLCAEMWSENQCAPSPYILPQNCQLLKNIEWGVVCASTNLVCTQLHKNLQVWASAWGSHWLICLRLLVHKWLCGFPSIQRCCARSRPKYIARVSRMEPLPMAYSCIHISWGVSQGKTNANVKACVFCSFSANDTVPNYFGGGDVWCSSCQLSRVFDEIAACCDKYVPCSSLTFMVWSRLQCAHT